MTSAKFAILRTIARESDLRLGLHWYLTRAGHRPADGKHIGYLSDPIARLRYESLDAALYRALATIVSSGTRTVAALERAKLLPAASAYFSQPLDHEGLSLSERRSSRTKWLDGAAASLAACDLVLLDPDNGLAVRSVGPCSRTAPKYVFPDDLLIYSPAQSVVVYQHLDRSGPAETQLDRKLAALAELLPSRSAFALRHRRGSSRAYLFAVTPRHRKGVARAIRSLLKGWGSDFGLHPTDALS